MPPCRLTSRAARDLADAGDAGVAVRASPTSASKSGIRAGLDAELLAHAGRVADGVAAAVHLHDAVAAHALREVLVGRPDADLLDAVVLAGDARGRGERVVGLELDHRPDGDSHGRERLLERLELREQRRVDARARLVPGPQVVAERLDHVVGRDADVRRAALEHLQHRVQHAGRRAERLPSLLPPRRRP